MIVGWSIYFRIAHNYSRAVDTLDHHALQRATKTLYNKFDLGTAQFLRKNSGGPP